MIWGGSRTQSAMNAIDTNTRVSPVSPVAGPAGKAGVSPFWSARLIRGADDASSLISASSLRVRLAGPHADSMRLSATAAAIDVADESLASAQSVLGAARLSIGNPDEGFDSALASVQDATGRARVGGVSILHEGTTLRAGASSLDIRPLSIGDLGAVVDKGRSYRLEDLRSGGALDARANPDAARRSTDAAMAEISTVRSDLKSFAQSALAPAQRAEMAAFGAISGVSPVTPLDPSVMRSDALSNAQAVRRALVGSQPEGVLRLLA